MENAPPASVDPAGSSFVGLALDLALTWARFTSVLVYAPRLIAVVESSFSWNWLQCHQKGKNEHVRFSSGEKERERITLVYRDAGDGAVKMKDARRPTFT